MQEKRLAITALPATGVLGCSAEQLGRWLWANQEVELWRLWLEMLRGAEGAAIEAVSAKWAAGHAAYAKMENDV